MTTKPSELADVLEKIRQKQVCAYLGSTRCDCKYGGDRIGQHGESGNGCPEMRTVIHLLRRMTDREYNMLLKRKPRPQFFVY